MQNEDRLKTMLSDLGRSTLRGIRKCPKCGTYNGIRGLTCKNKACDVIFRGSDGKRKQCIVVAKLNTGLSTQVFSVRVRDTGPDYRGFVQLSLGHPSDPDYLNQDTALCFVESCQRLFNTNILKCHEKEPSSFVYCQHIQSAMGCTDEAQVLPIDGAVLRSMKMSQQMEEAIVELSLETPGPVVQRISKSIMAVKCKVTTKHPLGFLHVSFFPSTKFSCCCISKNQPKTGDILKKCVHYYACIVAFASDAKCLQEFSSFINKEKSRDYSYEAASPDEHDELVAIIKTGLEDCVESVLQKDIMLSDISQEFDRLSSSIVEDIACDLKLDSALDSQNFESITTKSDETTMKNKPRKGQKRKKVQANKNDADERNIKDVKQDLRGTLQVSDDALDENNVKLSFIEWLSSVTERINQTMHFQFDGKPEPLIFHTPHVFFECFLERIMSPALMRRKRLPNLVTTFTRKTALPLGTFYTYTWHVSNILHAKAIFDTPFMLLNVRRGFILKSDGTYEELDSAEDEGVSKKEGGEQTIRPVTYRTYLKIGNTEPEQEQPSVLTIDWTPNFLPLSKIGELKITFEYGHSPS